MSGIITTKNVQVSTLNESEKLKALELSKKIDWKNSQSIMNFGIDTQKKLGSSSEKILNHVKTKDAGEVGGHLMELLTQISSYDMNQNGVEKFMSKVPLLGSLFNQGKKIIAKHQTVEANLEKIVENLDNSYLGLVKDNIHIKTMKEETISFIMENRVNIEAVRITMAEMINTIIPELEEKVRLHPNDNLIIEELSEAQNTLTRLDKKVYDMEAFEVASIQMIPRYNILHDGNTQLSDNIQKSIINTIPIWRSQVAEAIMLNNQKENADILETVNDMTNQMIKSNSDKMRENAIQIAKQNERGSIDIETLKHVNANIKGVIEDILKIKEEGSRARIEGEKELSKIKNELSDIVKNVHVETTTGTDFVDATYVEVQNTTSLIDKK